MKSISFSPTSQKIDTNSDFFLITLCFLGAASPNTTNTEVAFAETREYSLLGAKIQLHPIGLVSKRLFSKKYPIAVVLPQGRNASSSDVGENNSPEREAEASLRLRRRRRGEQADHVSHFGHDIGDGLLISSLPC